MELCTNSCRQPNHDLCSFSLLRERGREGEGKRRGRGRRKQVVEEGGGGGGRAREGGEERKHISVTIVTTSVNAKRGYACYDCCMLSSPAFVCIHAAL